MFMALQPVDTCIFALDKVMFFSVYDFFVRNPLDVGCVLIDNLVLDE